LKVCWILAEKYFYVRKNVLEMERVPSRRQCLLSKAGASDAEGRNVRKWQILLQNPKNAVRLISRQNRNERQSHAGMVSDSLPTSLMSSSLDNVVVT
jgi:hypothetical protein